MIMVLFSCRAGYREKYDHFILFFKWLLRVLHQEGVVFELFIEQGYYRGLSPNFPKWMDRE
jgi:hypothetical protein